MSSYDTLPLGDLRRRRSERGAVMIMVAITGLLLVGFLGLAIDTSHVRTAERELQSAADAAARAAAYQMSNATFSGQAVDTAVARDKAVAVALQNTVVGTGITLAPSDVVFGDWDAAAGTFTLDPATPDAVMVTARRDAASSQGPVDLFFGGIFGTGTVDLERKAIARMTVSKQPMLHVLHPWRCGALSTFDTPTLDVAGRSVVNSCASQAIRVMNDSKLVATEIVTNGGASWSQSKNAIVGPISEYAPVEPDYLSGVLAGNGAIAALKASMPKPKGDKGRINKSGVYVPGYYPKGLRLKDGKAAYLEPGVYVLGGNGLIMSGSTLLEGEGVTLVIDDGGRVEIKNSACAILSPPTSGETEGITVFNSRKNTGCYNGITIATYGVIDIQGTVYSPSSHVYVASTTGTKSIGGLVAETLDVSCYGTVEIDGRQARLVAGGAASQVVQ